MQTQNIYFGEYQNKYRFPDIDSSSFYGKPDERYFLDKYTRFTTFDDLLREYVTGAMARKRKGGYYFMVYDRPNNSTVMENPMVLLDGVPIFDADKIMAFDPLKVQRLDVLTKKYLLGPLFFTGCLSYATYKGDLGGFQLDPSALLQEYEGMQLQREFYAPRYDSPEQVKSRRPDFRNLLYWKPNVEVNSQGKVNLDFYTSDQEGVYMVVVNGLSPQGYAGSTTFTFEVKDTAK